MTPRGGGSGCGDVDRHDPHRTRSGTTDCTDMSPPLIVEVTRGGFVESRHEVDVAVVGADGHRSGFGQPRRPVLARSSMKPIQAFPLVATGAAKAFDLSTEHVALACASHNGEPVHVDLVTGWLDRLDLTIDDLECGSHLPYHQPSAHELVRSGVAPDRRHHNCSGKHCGFLTVCRHLGIDTAGYLRPDHPVQALHITKAIEAACEISVDGQTPVVDGCGIPIWEVPLDGLAQGWATVAGTPEGEVIFDAMTRSPVLVAGSDRMCTYVMTASDGAWAVKVGAEGVYSGVHREAGLAFSLKARDGATRAAEAAMLWVLGDLGLPVPVTMPSVTNAAGVVVGEIRVKA
ncbi:MAG: asparaginase [Actinomycetota bacterium]